MATDSKQNLKTLRVDNWAVFFLQRLQLLFAKGDCCDLTLKFHTGQELKVHRLVLITCTSFFECMEKDEGNVINMPEALPYSVVQPIINFLYSGKLEFKSDLHSQLLNTSKSLNITILSKLLVTQKNDNGLAAALAKPGDTKKPQRTFLATRIGPAPIGGLGGRKLPIWRQRSFPLYRPDRNRVVKDEEPRPMRFEWPEGKEPTDSLLLTSPSFTPLSYKSEPVFTPANPPLLRSQPQASPSSPPGTSLKRRVPWPSSVPDKVFKDDKKGDPLKDVKKEVPEEPGGEFSDDDDGHFETIHTYGDSDDDHEQDSPVKAQPPPPVVKAQPVPVKPPPSVLTYRPAPKAQKVQPPIISMTEAFEPLAESTPAIPSSSLLPPTPKPILKQTEPQLGQTPTKKVRFSIASDEESSNVALQPEVTEKVLEPSPPSDVMFESQSVPSPTHPINSVSTNQLPPQPEEFVDLTAPQPSPVTTTAQVSTPVKSDTIQTYSKAPTRKEKKTFSPADSANHAKIIAEVLKKYPDLVKNNKNIRLKISAPGSSSITNTLTLDTKRTAGKAYVVVKSSVKTEPPPPTKPETPSSSTMMAPRPTITLPPQPSVAGPWICSTCDNGGGTIKFSSYYEYRKHFQDVHNEKFDSRTCEYCGYKTSKRNLYLYHLFTKHNVAPPKNIDFPKCDQCGYIALSDGLLQKHISTHKPPKKDWPCPRCELVFNSYPGLQTHIASCRGIRSKQCSLCQATFISDSIYNEHMKVCGSANKAVATTETSTENSIGIYDEPGPQPEQTVEMIEVPLMNTDALGGKSGHTYVQLPSGLILTDGNNVLLPAADGDELNAVGSNMGGPMGLTVALPQDQHVILLDANSEFFLQGNDQVIVRRLNPVNSTEEYIVPEVLDESMQQIYTTQGLPYSVATTAGNMVACPLLPIDSSSQNMDKEDNSGNTVVRVHDHIDSHELDVQHHVNANDMESIIVQDTSSNNVDQRRHSTDSQVDVYVEEPQEVITQPQQHHHTMAINKELMDVVAMEVQRAPTMMDNSSVAMSLPEMQSQNETVLRRSEREVVVTSTNNYVTSNMVMVPEGTVLEQMSVVQEVPDGSDSAIQPPVDDSHLPEEHPPTVVPHVEGEDGEKRANQAAKVDSLVKDWGFDNEEEAAEGANDDSDSDESGAQTGPSRVTVEL